MDNLMPLAQIPQMLRRHLISRVPHVLAALEFGVQGALLAMAWLAVASRLRGEYWWSCLNLAGAAVYGERVFHMGLSRASLAGAAILICVYTAVAVLFSLVLPQGAGAFRAAVLGAATGCLWHYVAESYFWSVVSPVFGWYTHPWVLFIGNVLFGLYLGWIPVRLAARRGPQTPPPGPEPAIGIDDSPGTPEDC